MERIGVIDIGSNTIHLDVFDITADRRIARKVLSSGTVNTLGLCLSRDRMIPPAKFREAVAIIGALFTKARKARAKTVYAFGTSIMRHARNAHALIAAVRRKWGIVIDVVSDSREAWYIEVAIRSAWPLDRRRMLCVDIGGGSTEYVLLNKHKTMFRRSYRYGLSKVKGMITSGALTGDAAVRQLIGIFDRKVAVLKQALRGKRVDGIVGTSSVIKTIARLRYPNLHNYNALMGKIVYHNFLARLQRHLTRTPQTVALEAERKDIVFVGLIFFLRLLAGFKKDHVNVFSLSIREGYVLDKLRRNETRTKE